MLYLDPILDAIGDLYSESFKEFAKGGKKGGGKGGGKKNCKKQQCGNSCIAVNKVCRKGITAAGQTTGPKTKAKASKKTTDGGAGADENQKSSKPRLPNGVTFEDDPSFGTTVYRFKIGETSIRMSYDESDGAREVFFFVNSRLDKTDTNLTFRQRGEVAAKLKQIHAFDVSRQKDGVVYKTAAYNGDGFGEMRAKVYEKAGFSPPSDGVIGNDHYGVVLNQKLVPSDQDGKPI